MSAAGFFWVAQRVVLTGGAGFLGRVVHRKLQERGCKEIIIPRSASCDLREIANIRRLLAEARTSMVIHLAGVVEGIGANRMNPGKFFYENAVMEFTSARRHDVPAWASLCKWGPSAHIPNSPP